MINLFFYIGCRWINFWKYNFIYILFLFSETFLLIFGTFNTYIIGWHYFSKSKYNQEIDEENNISHKGVDIYICCYNEPLSVIKECIKHTMNIDYDKKTIFVCDDGKNSELKKYVEKLQTTSVIYKNRSLISGHAKAGNINDTLYSYYNQNEYLLILDCDMNADKSIIKTLIPYLKDENVAFVQSPQRFYNIKGLDSLGQQYYYFYNVILKVWDKYGNVPCCGTNVLLKKKFLYDIKGFSYDSVTEDFVTSLLLHSNKYESRFCPIELARGLAPFTLCDFYKQRFRWSFGSCQLISTLKKNWKQLNSIQKYIYLNAFFNLHLSIFMMVLISFPILRLYFPYILINLSNLNMNFYGIIFGSYLLSFFTILFVLYKEIPKFYLIKNLQETICLLYCNLIVLFWYYFKIPYQFKITPKIKNNSFLNNLLWIWPFHIYLFSTIYGIYYYKYILYQQLDLVNLIWIGFILFQMLPIFIYPFTN
jgi:cellulose synthase/poly-beta-1,6-N-acetylglucosamine synthase-like glycosyltransferase